MFFSLIKSGTFFSTSKLIRIFDKRGVPFYFFDSNSEKHFFNLPSGEYETENDIFVSPEPLEYPSPYLPEPKKNDYKRIKKVLVKIGHTPHKAFIIIPRTKKTAKIIIDKGIVNMPRYAQAFVSWHELGHLRYSKESNADKFAEYMMLKQGYNPSQIKDASKILLSKCACKRKKLTEKSMKEISQETFNSYPNVNR